MLPSEMSKGGLLALLLSCVCILGVPGTLFAAIIHVDHDAPNDPGPDDTSISDPNEDGSAEHPFDAIQEGIDAAEEGDEVVIEDGTYTGDGNRDLDFGGKGITVRSASGDPTKSIIDCKADSSNRHRGFYFHSHEAATARVEGLTITGAYVQAYGAGIYCAESSPTIVECIIEHNDGHHGCGFYCEGAVPTLVRCTIRSNTSSGRGGGVYAQSGVFQDCAITDNAARYRGGGVYGDGVRLLNCDICRNASTSEYGGGVYATGDSVIANCLITANNSADDGGGVYLAGDTSVLAGCIIAGNTAFSEYYFLRGGGIYCSGSAAAIVNCTICGNTSSSHGVCCRGGSSVVFANTIIRANSRPDLDPGYAANYSVTYSNIAGGAEGEGNVDIDYALRDGPSGYWTSAPVYDPVTGTTTFADRTADFPAFTSRGQLLKPDVRQTVQLPISANTATTITVLGDYSETVLSGAEYRVHDYRLRTGTPCVDAGSNPAVPADTYDLDGDGNTTEPLPLDLDSGLRFVDDPYAPDTGEPGPPGPLVDMGALEHQPGCTSNMDCDDANPCTNDACIDEACTHTVVADGSSCDDGRFCNGEEFCWSGTCVAEGAPCGDEDCPYCDEVEDICFHVPEGAVFVDDSAWSGAHDGSSWEDAYRELWSILDGASHPSSTITEIWVADGEYPLDFDSRTYQLVNDVTVRGGFAGLSNPDNPFERDLSRYESILSGDVEGDDGPAFSNYDDNAYHVVTSYDNDATAVIDGFTITGGYADYSESHGRGGGIYNVDSSPTVRNCKVVANWATADDGGGGGIYNRDSSPTIVNCLITGNGTDGAGGGMLNSQYLAAPTVTDCVFVGNYALKDGGGAYNVYGDPTYVRCTFRANYTERQGGGVYCALDGDRVYKDCVFTANSAEGNGGGLYADSDQPGVLAITGCTFAHNTSESGGGVYLAASHAVFANNVLTKNSASDAGGGLSCYFGRPVINCEITHNESGNLGGAVYVRGGDDPGLVNCTMIGNQAVTDGNAAFFTEGSTPGVYNCIIRGSTPDPLAGGEPIVSYCNIEGGWPGEGNIDAEPLFMDPDGRDDIPGTADDDWRLLPYSPCLDAGSNLLVVEDLGDFDGDGDTTERVPLDMRGDPRFDDDPVTSDTGVADPPAYPEVVDIGAHEGLDLIVYGPSSLTIPEGESASFAVALRRDPQRALLLMVLRHAGDPYVEILAGASLSFDSSNFGTPQLVTVAFPEDDDRIDDSAELILNAAGLIPRYVQAYEEDNDTSMLYVDADAPGVDDGGDWENAFTDLQSALAKAELDADVGEIRVAAGTYHPAEPDGPRTSSFDLKSGLALRGGFAGYGTPDPDARDVTAYPTTLSGDLNDNDGDAFLNYDDNSYHVITAEDVDASTLLDGFTITGGNANDVATPHWDGGGILLYRSSPAIAQCTIVANRADVDGGGVYCNEGSSPTISNCTITGNVAGDDGAGVYLLTNSNAVITACAVSNNVAADQGGGLRISVSAASVSDCIIEANSAWNGGGVYFWEGNSSLDKCRISANVAGSWGGGVHCTWSESTLVDCSITGNESDYTGGGIHLYGGGNSLRNCLIAGNATTEYGGGVSCYYSAEPTFVNCTLNGNLAPQGPGLACFYSQAGLHPSTVTMTNMVLTDGNDWFWTNNDSVVALAYSDIQGGWEGRRQHRPRPTLCAAWLLGRDAGTPGDPDDDVWVDGDYHLLPNSALY